MVRPKTAPTKVITDHSRQCRESLVWKKNLALLAEGVKYQTQLKKTISGVRPKTAPTKLTTNHCSQCKESFGIEKHSYITRRVGKIPTLIKKKLEGKTLNCPNESDH